MVKKLHFGLKPVFFFLRYLLNVIQKNVLYVHITPRFIVGERAFTSFVWL